MQPPPHYWGPLMIGFGIVYMIKPNIFMRGIWKRTAISQRMLTPEQNVTYMRVLGAVFVVIGAVAVLMKW